MPIPNNIKQPIYVSFVMGVENDKTVYTEPIKIYVQKNDVKSLVTRDDVGIIPDYDRLILVPYGDMSKYINEETLLWVDVEPNGQNMDYQIKRVGDIIDGNFTLFCNSLTKNTVPLYYNIGDRIIKTKVDMKDLVAIVPFNQYLPIDKESKLWLVRPEDISSTDGLIRLVKKTKLEKSYQLIFEKV